MDTDYFKYKEMRLVVEGKILFIENTLRCKQLMSEVTTDNQSILDHIYSNIKDINTDTMDCCWSDHKILYAAVPFHCL